MFFGLLDTRIGFPGFRCFPDRNTAIWKMSPGWVGVNMVRCTGFLGWVLFSRWVRLLTQSDGGRFLGNEWPTFYLDVSEGFSAFFPVLGFCSLCRNPCFCILVWALGFR